MSGQVVVDASIAVKWFVWEENSDSARALLSEWGADDVEIAAPRMLLSETANTLLKKVRQGVLTGAEAREMTRDLRQMDIEFVGWPELHEQAIDLALSMDHPAVYDTLYLAVAEELGCDLWLADSPFYERALAAGHSVRLLRRA